MTDMPDHDHNEPWDDTDLAALAEFRDRGMTYRECAERLGRTPGAVGSKLYRLRKR